MNLALYHTSFFFTIRRTLLNSSAVESYVERPYFSFLSCPAAVLRNNRRVRHVVVARLGALLRSGVVLPRASMPLLLANKPVLPKTRK